MLAWLGIEPTTLCHSFKSAVYDHLAMTTPIRKIIKASLVKFSVLQPFEDCTKISDLSDFNLLGDKMGIEIAPKKHGDKRVYNLQNTNGFGQH